MLQLRSLPFWRNLPLRSQIVAGMLVPLLVLALSAVLVHTLLRSAHEDLARSEQSVHAVALYSTLLNAVLDGQTGARGFVITGQTRFLEPYHDARAQFAAVMTELEQIETPGSQSHERLRQIEELFSQFLRNVAEPVIALRMQSPERLFGAAFAAASALDALLREVEQGHSSNAALETYTTRVAWAQRIAEGSPLGIAWRPAQELHQGFVAALQQDAPGATAVALRRGAALRRELLALTGAAGEIEDGAAGIIASGQGKELIDQLRVLIRDGAATHSGHHADLAGEAHLHTGMVPALAVFLPIGAGLLGMVLLLAMHIDQLRTIRQLCAAADAVASDQPTPPICLDRTDELGELATSFSLMAAELADRRTQMQNLDAFQSMLLSSVTAQEAFGVTARACVELLPKLSGELFLISASSNTAELVAHWPSAPAPAKAIFEPSACRALRSGHDHYATRSTVEVFCNHTETAATAALCIPLTSKGVVLGILSFTSYAPERVISNEERVLAETIATRLALAVANLRLAESLRAQSIRDPLTGCFNRRYLEETLERELARTRRSASSLALLAVDADHFKRFNDEFGHDAGDLVLKELAGVLRRGVRAADIVCRYGGEEFVVVLPEADESAARHVAEKLRRSVAQLTLNQRGNALGSISISIGIALCPDHATSADQLIQQADAALYRAKHLGRNRAEVAMPTPDALAGRLS